MAILQEKVGITNEDLRKLRSMRPGRPLDLQISTPNATKRVRSEFVGMDGTRCLMLRFPDESKWGTLGDAIFKDKSMVLRYILEDDTGEIIAFKVKVILILTRPSHLIFTSFPLAVQSHGLRGERRAQTNIASTMLDADSGEVMCQCVVTDISIHGCGISLEKINQGLRPIIKQNITMTFDGIDDKKISIKGVIRNTKSDEVNLYYGVKFEDSESDVEQQLKSLTLMID